MLSWRNLYIDIRLDLSKIWHCLMHKHKLMSKFFNKMWMWGKLQIFLLTLELTMSRKFFLYWKFTLLMVILCVLFLSEPTGTSSTWNSNYTSKGFSYGMNSKDPTPQPTPRTGRNNNASFNDSSLWWQKCADKGDATPVNSCLTQWKKC